MTNESAYAYPLSEFLEDIPLLIEESDGAKVLEILVQRKATREEAVWKFRRLAHAQQHLYDLLQYDTRFRHFAKPRPDGKMVDFPTSLLEPIWKTSTGLPDSFLGMRAHPQAILDLIRPGTAADEPWMKG